MGNGAARQTESYRLQSHDLANARRHIKFFLGRDPLNAEEVWDYAGDSGSDSLGKILRSNEFRGEIWLPILLGGWPASDRYRGAPNKSIIDWIGQSFPLEGSTVEIISDLTSWHDLLSAVWADNRFRDCVRAYGHSPKAINRFQQGLQTGKDARSLRAVPKFVSPGASIPTCSLLVANNNISNYPIDPEQVDLTKHINETHNLTEIKAYTAAYDPQIIIPANLVGSFIIDIDIEFISEIASADASYLQIFLDFGSGWQESDSYTVGIVDNRVCTTLYLESDRAIHRIRIDPSVYASVFVVKKLNLSEL
ncbi:hypothetical protein SAMN05216360_1082 [Methylobacterium phyllostachyos]|uniref:Uncharacterized protein n=1 Tax=Methylobacterium phyllostachyos TaxID=582672 RepID=A0A1H0B168_9HYPH|nr:hypothetical protein [Methylobacterium phyllostachyos]SDN39368.1 hypothetical protein SAMN05216360_1082 [Methylobacterium phyllostachyos]